MDDLEVKRLSMHERRVMAETLIRSARKRLAELDAEAKQEWAKIHEATLAYNEANDYLTSIGEGD